MSWFLALLLKPFVGLFLAFFVFAPPVYAVHRWLPDGYLKRLLLFRIHNGEHYTIKESLRSLRDGR